MDAAIERLEKALVGTCIGEPLDVLPRVMAAGAAADWFLSPKWRLAFRAIEDLWRTGGAERIDDYTVADRARKIAAGAAERDGEAVQVPTPDDLEDAFMARSVNAVEECCGILMSDIEGCGKLEQYASTVAILHVDDAAKDEWAKRPPVWLCPEEAQGAAESYCERGLAPVWYILAKNQNGPVGRLPFVFYKRHFAFMLGDVGAEKTAKFAKVHTDWRGAAIEETLRSRGVLIERRRENGELYGD